MGDESWKLNHFPLPFWYFHGDTHARFHVFCGNTSQNVEIFGHHVYRCGNTSLTHTRLQSLFLSLWETHTYLLALEVCNLETHGAFPCFLLLTTGNTCAFHANLLSSSLEQQETPGFEVLQRRSLCYHISAAAMLPVKLCSTWAETLSSHTKHPFPGQKTAIFANLFVSCLTYVLFHVIFPYLLI